MTKKYQFILTLTLAAITVIAGRQITEGNNFWRIMTAIFLIFSFAMFYKLVNK